jgi:hypothetical protein
VASRRSANWNKSSATASPTGDPAALSTPTSSAPSGVMLCREAWGARPPRPGGAPQIPAGNDPPHGVDPRRQQHAPIHIRADQRYHQARKGGSISPITLASPAAETSTNCAILSSSETPPQATTRPAATSSSFARNFDEEEVTEELLTGVALASAWAARHFFISPDTLSGHRDFAATSCPGANVHAHIASGEIKRRIEDLWPAVQSEFSRHSTVRRTFCAAATLAAGGVSADFRVTLFARFRSFCGAPAPRPR